MKFSKAFPSLYLASDDLGKDEWNVTIKKVAMEGVGQDKDPKLILFFEDIEKGMVCNKTNGNTVKRLYGDELDEWIGKKVTLWVNHDVEFKGELVSAIRIRAKAPDA